MKKLGKLAGLAVGLGLFTLFLSRTNLHELYAALSSADPWLLALGVASGLASFFFRALRWRSLLMPLKKTRVNNVVGILMVGYTVSNLLPGRLGDFVVRPYLIGRTENVSKAAAFATIVVERIFDMLYVLVLLAAFVTLSPQSLSGPDFKLVRPVGAALLALALAAVGMLFVLRTHGDWIQAWAVRPLALLPARWHERGKAMVESLVTGMGLFRDTRNAVISMVHGALTWLLIALTFFFVCRALDLTMVTLVGTFLLIGLGAVGVAIPVPAGIGSFHFLIAKGLTILGAQDDARIKAAAILIHLTSVVPITAMGLYYWMRMGLSEAQIEALAEDQA